jgi:K+-sensing histidine kinase KdpD
MRQPRQQSDCALSPSENDPVLAERLAPQAPEPPFFITRRLTRLVRDIPPYSLRALSIAVACFLGALVFQLALHSLGGSLLFAAFYPAVLVAGLIAGVPPGMFVMVGSLLTAWWAFIPPKYAFFPLTPTQQVDLAAYMLASGCVLTVTALYRQSLSRLRKNDEERELMMKELEHRAEIRMPLLT